MEKTQANSVLMKYKEELMPKLKPIISREMTFDYFSKQMEALKYFHDEQDKRQNLLNQMFPESYPIEDLGNSLFECYGSFLSDMCGDTDRWIDYYIDETDWGTKDMGVKLDGKPRRLKDYKDLYDIIKERYGK